MSEQRPVKWFRFETNIVLNVEGKSFVISKADSRYEGIVKAIEEGKDEDIRSLLFTDNIKRLKDLLDF